MHQSVAYVYRIWCKGWYLVEGTIAYFPSVERQLIFIPHHPVFVCDCVCVSVCARMYVHVCVDCNIIT